MEDTTIPHGMTWTFAIMPAWWFCAMSSLLVAELGTGATSGVRFSGFVGTEMRDWPNPALPLGPGVRVLTEALAGFGAMAVWHVPVTLALILLGLSPRWNAHYWYPGSPERASVATMCVVLPVAVAWLLPRRNRLIHLLRGLIVAIVAIVPVAIAMHSVPLIVVFTMTLVAGLLATAHVAMMPGRFTHAARPSRPIVTPRASRPSHPAVMVRVSRPPLAQLWHDACLGPLRGGKPGFIICVACFVLARALAFAHAGPELLVQMLSIAPFAWVAVPLALLPLGIPTFAACRGGAAGLFNGYMGTAWTSLPLRREWVMRAVYIHGIVTGLAVVGFNLLGTKITGAPDIFWPGFTSGDIFSAGSTGDLIGWVSFVCAVPPFAGFLTCRAAGDKRRGAISLASLIVLIGWGVIASDLVKPIAFVLVMVFAIAGGAPPLVHLFGRRTRR